MRTWRSKALQWEKRDLLSRMRPKCGPNLELLRTSSRYFHQNAMRSLKSTFCDKSAVLFILEGMFYNPISQKMHALTLVLNLIDTSLSLFHSFTATFLSRLGKWDLLCEMRPKCGPFHQFSPNADQVRNCGLLWKQCITLFRDNCQKMLQFDIYLCILGCSKKTLFQNKNKRNPPRISLGVSLKGSKRIFDFDQV